MSEKSNEIKKTNNPAPKNGVDRFSSNQKHERKEDSPGNKNKPYRAVADIVKEMGYDWIKVKKDLAIRATGKYISYEEDKEGNRKQNDEIRAKILSGKEFKPDLNQSISKFSVEKQNTIKKIVGDGEFSIDRVGSYVSTLPKDQAEILEKLPNEKFIGFIHQELEVSKNISDKLGNIYGPEVQKTTKEQLGNIVALSNVSEKIQKFVSENKQFEKYQIEAIAEAKPILLKIERKTLEFEIKRDQIKKQKLAVKTPVDQEKVLKIEKQLDIEEESFKKDENVILLSKYGGSYAATEEHLAMVLATKRINESQELKDLSPEKKQEFNAILVDVYGHNEKVSPELNEMYFPDMKVEIEQKEREINQINLNVSKSFADSQKTVLENKEFNNYFKDNYINEFVDEEQKDQKYRDNLQKLYPNSKNIIQDSFAGMPDYQLCFDESGNINKNELTKLPKDKQDVFTAEIKEKLKFVDDELVGNINSAVKEQSVETCLATLSKCMNIKFDDGTKEDMIKNFDFTSKMNDDLVIDFNGTLNGKKINMSYNMIDGKVYYQEYLYKDKGTNTFKKSDPNVETEMLFVELPKLEDFVSTSKSLDYTKEMGDAKNIDDFHSAIKDRLNSQVQKNIDIKDARENFEKSMLQDISMQEAFTFMGYGENKNLSDIDPKEEPNLYKLYSMLYDSVCFYTKDELKFFRQMIKTLEAQKSKISPDYNNLNMGREQLENDMNINEERLFFDLSMNDIVSKTSGKKEAESNSYLGFFECFIQEETNPPLSVIDLSEMKDYMGKLDKEINNDSENVLEWKRNNIFKKNLGRIRDNYDVLAIEKSF